MTARILPLFDQRPAEGALIGRMLAAYGELELELLNCVELIRDPADFDIVLKAMFRTRGETQRIDIADAIGRQYFESFQLGTPFAMLVGSIRHCLRIRNQYAHCHWFGADLQTGRIAFVNLEELAKTHVNVFRLDQASKHYVDFALLELQTAFFDYTQGCAWALADDAAAKSGKLNRRLGLPFARSGQLPQPALFLP